MKDKLVIFDCFGVIFDEVAVRFFNRHFEPQQAAVIKDKYFIPADLGEVEYDEIFEKMSAELNWDKQELMTEWNSLFVLRKEMIPVIKWAGEKADVVLLSNAPKGVVEKMFRENGISDLFLEMTVSANVKMAKPDKAIYRYCVDRMNKKYSKVYMIDHSLKNLEGLEDIGITPKLFEGIDELRVRLETELGK